MNTKFPALLLALAFAGAGRAADACAPGCCPIPPSSEPKSSCCVEAPAARSSCCADEPPAAPFTGRSLYQLDAAWTTDAGKTVTLASFRGRPVVLAMFFASCEYACPVLTSDMQRLRELLPVDVRAQTRFVLVTFDVERDTPAALQGYRERAMLDGDAWTLLRSDADSVQELAMLLGVRYKQDARGQFSHSNLFTVLNPEGEIVHQRAGLMGDVSDAARAVTHAVK
jgi:protein SCO1